MNQRREIAWEMKRAKNNWFQQKAREVERGLRVRQVHEESDGNSKRKSMFMVYQA